MAKITRVDILKRDFQNVVRFGIGAPKFAERIFVNPKDCIRVATLHRLESAAVKSWYPDVCSNIVNVLELTKVKCCIDHWAGGVPWWRTGVYEEMERLLAKFGRFDDCATYEDVLRRYERLDVIFETVRKEGRLKSVGEVNSAAFREFGGIHVHIGPDGETFFGKGGSHRFSMALVLGLPQIPAQLGCVDPSGVKAVKALRRPR